MSWDDYDPTNTMRGGSIVAPKRAKPMLAMARKVPEMRRSPSVPVSPQRAVPPNTRIGKGAKY